jgi:hypothetical protein
MKNPDKWIIVKVPGGAKVLGSWSGGYLDGDSWQLSSGLERIEEDGDYYLMHNVSGSIYKCHKKMEGMHNLAASILKQLQDMDDSVKTITVEEFNENKQSN